MPFLSLFRIILRLNENTEFTILLVTVICTVVVGSCRPFQRSVQEQHVYEAGEFDVRCELVLLHVYEVESTQYSTPQPRLS